MNYSLVHNSILINGIIPVELGSIIPYIDIQKMNHLDFLSKISWRKKNILETLGVSKCVFFSFVLSSLIFLHPFVVQGTHHAARTLHFA